MGQGDPDCGYPGRLSGYPDRFFLDFDTLCVAHVACGSLADISQLLRHVRYTPQSRLSAHNLGSSARSRIVNCNNMQLYSITSSAACGTPPSVRSSARILWCAPISSSTGC